MMQTSDINFLSVLHSPFIIPVLAIAGGIVISLVSIISTQWRKARQAELEAALKQDMLTRGFSADDIERVMPGFDGAFTQQDDQLAPPGNALHFRQGLELQAADKIEQCFVLGSDAGQFHTLVTKLA